MMLSLKQSLPYLGGFLGAVLLATAAFVGGYWYRGIVGEQLQPTSEVSPSPSPSPEIEAQVVNLDHGLDMSDWVTSTSDNLGISLKHPKAWYGMDYNQWFGNIGGIPAFGLTSPLRVDLNKYQQTQIEGERIRFTIANVTSLTKPSEVEDALNRMALGFDRVERKTFIMNGLRGTLDYDYFKVHRGIEHVVGYLVTDDNDVYRVTYTVVDKTLQPDFQPYEQQLVEQVISTLRLLED